MSKSYFKYIVLTLLIGSLTITLCVFYNAPKAKLRCSGELIARKKLSDISSAELHTNIFIFLSSDGKGFITHKGELTVDHKAYHVDHEAHFGYVKLDEDGIYTFKVTEEVIRTGDTLPEQFSQLFPFIGISSLDQAYYISVTHSREKVLFIHELSVPILICRKS